MTSTYVEYASSKCEFFFPEFLWGVLNWEKNNMTALLPIRTPIPLENLTTRSFYHELPFSTFSHFHGLPHETSTFLGVHVFFQSAYFSYETIFMGHFMGFMANSW